MRVALAYALRRGAARLVLGLGVLGLITTALPRAWPWSHPSMKPEPQVRFSPLATTWDIPVAAAALVLGLVLAVLIYRRRSTTR